jgi:hypothetical protein
LFADGSLPQFGARRHQADRARRHRRPSTGGRNGAARLKQHCASRRFAKPHMLIRRTMAERPAPPGISDCWGEGAATARWSAVCDLSRHKRSHPTASPQSVAPLANTALCWQIEAFEADGGTTIIADTIRWERPNRAASAGLGEFCASSPKVMRLL